MNTLEKIDEMAADTLRGDMRDFMLDLFKRRPKPWQQMSEQEQQDLVLRCSEHAEDIIDRLALLISTAGQESIPGKLVQFTVKDGVKAQVDFLSTGENLDFLGSSVQGYVRVIRVDTEQFKGQRQDAEIDKDEPALFDQTDQGRDHAAEVA